VKNKFLILALVVVFAFGALGIGYAHWSQTLYVDGTVNTGKLCWGFESGSLLSLYDSSNDPPPYKDGVAEVDKDPSIGVGFWGDVIKLDKNVGWVTLELRDDKGCDHKGKKLYATANVCLHNVYPCYYAEIHVRVANGGTIPVNFESLKLDGVEIEVGEHYWNDWMEFSWGNGPPEEIQIDPCGWKEISFMIHILQEGDVPAPGADPVAGAEQGATYTFDIEMVGVQWNKAD
jgi:hypothetical protein